MMVVPLIIANAQLTRKEFASLKIFAQHRCRTVALALWRIAAAAR